MRRVGGRFATGIGWAVGNRRHGWWGRLMTGTVRPLGGGYTVAVRQGNDVGVVGPVGGGRGAMGIGGAVGKPPPR